MNKKIIGSCPENKEVICPHLKIEELCLVDNQEPVELQLCNSIIPREYQYLGTIGNTKCLMCRRVLFDYILETNVLDNRSDV